MQICEFLYKLKSSNPPQDTEKIIITTFVSCAEAVYRINKPDEVISENLVKGFFKPVQESLKIRGYVGGIPYEKFFGAVEVLYLIRNDYIHNGNFTGKLFKSTNRKNKQSISLGHFCFSEKDNKTLLIEAHSECCITYEEFVEIFLEAFIKNIESYCDKNKK